MTTHLAVHHAWTTRGRRAVLAALAALPLIAAGCSSGGGGGGVASLSASAGASTSAAPKAGALAYSQCMRRHGVPSFPDPDADGRLQLKMGPGTGIDPNSAQFKAAQQACKALQPTPPAAVQQRNYDALLKFAQCMRKHGVPGFPDPTADGGLILKAKPGDSSLDPNSPAFKRAQQACQQYMPGGKGGPAGGSDGQK
jgi:hypothetical protein